MILREYLYGIPSALSLSEVEEIESIAEQLEWRPGMTGVSDDEDGDDDSLINHSIRSSKVKWIERLPDKLESKIADLMTQCLDDTMWGWTIDDHQAYQYTVYEAKPDSPKGDFYTWHTDHGHDMIDSNGKIRKLSFTLQLSDPDDYEGGLFQWIEPAAAFDRMTLNQKTINIEDSIRTIPFSLKEKGSILFFPSFTHHQVTPVTRGVRKSLVGWCIGDPYV